MLNRTQPRDVLRAAIDEREGRQRRVDAASATLACADDLRREALCQAELAEVEEAIISHRADVMRAAATRTARSRVWPCLRAYCPPPGMRRGARERRRRRVRPEGAVRPT